MIGRYGGAGWRWRQQRDELDDPRVYAAVIAFEGVRDCLFGACADATEVRSRSNTLAQSGRRLLRLARGRGAKSKLIAPDELSRLAEAVHWTVLQAVARGDDIDALAQRMESARSVYRANALFPRPATPETRVGSFRRAIILVERGRTASASEYARDVVVACAKAMGFRRPSRLFQFEEKRIKRALSRNSP